MYIAAYALCRCRASVDQESRPSRHVLVPLRSDKHVRRQRLSTCLFSWLEGSLHRSPNLSSHSLEIKSELDYLKD
jgi:hypothetical protein